MRAAPRGAREAGARNRDASDNEPLHHLRHGQNERALALGRKAWLFCGADRGGERAAVLYTLIQTARLNNVDPQAWLADVLARIAGHSAQHLDELLPWNWAPPIVLAKAA